MFNDDENAVKRYSFNSSKQIDLNNSIFNVDITFGNNHVQNLDLNVTSNDGQPVVVVGQEIYDDGTPVDDSKNYNALILDDTSDIPMLCASALSTWTKYLPSSHANVYTTNSFNTNSSVFINTKQYSTSSFFKYDTKVRYSIVKKNMLYDTVYCSTNYSANSRSVAQKIYMTPGIQTGVYLKFENYSDVDSSEQAIAKVTLIGEIYNK